MSMTFPSQDLFEALRQGLLADPSCTDGLDPLDAYFGLAIDADLYVFEFNGGECTAIIRGGNELDLDFVLAGPLSGWKQVLAAGPQEDGPRAGPATLASVIEEGALEVRSQDDEGCELAQGSIAFLQIFLERGRALEFDYS